MEKQINMADVTIHVDETLDEARQKELVEFIRHHHGVVAIGHNAKQPHLMVVEYDTDETDSSHLLAAVQAEGVHAELVGL